jgi:hypothetical protein
MKKTANPKQSRRKGAEWEAKIVNYMIGRHPDAHRNYDQGELPNTPPDVEAGIWAIEAKCGAKPPFLAGYREAIERAPSGKVPICMVHVDGANRQRRKHEIVMMSLETFLLLDAITASKLGPQRSSDPTAASPQAPAPAS